MPFRDLAFDEIEALVGTRHAVTGVEYPPIGLQPYYTWLMATLHHLSQSSAGGLRVERDAANDSAVRVAPGWASIWGFTLAFDGSVVDLTAFNNDTALLWLAINDDDEAVVPAGVESGGWPEGPHIPLAVVTLAEGRVTQIVDLRFASMLSTAPVIRRLSPIADLEQSISSPPTQEEVQAIQDTLNELLATLRASRLMPE